MFLGKQSSHAWLHINFYSNSLSVAKSLPHFCKWRHRLRLFFHLLAVLQHYCISDVSFFLRGKDYWKHIWSCPLLCAMAFHRHFNQVWHFHPYLLSALWSEAKVDEVLILYNTGNESFCYLEQSLFYLMVLAAWENFWWCQTWWQ